MTSLSQYIFLIPLLPLIGFLLNGLGRKVWSKPVSGIIGSVSVLSAFLISLALFMQSPAEATERIHYAQLFEVKTLSIGITFQIDALTRLFLLIITGVGFLIHLYSTAYMKEEEPHDFAKYFAYLNLFVFSMLVLVLGGNLLLLFVGWEGVGLCSYLLIGFWFKNKNYTQAANKAFIMNRIGDLGFLLAMFWLIAKLGTLEYNQIFTEAALAKLSAFDITCITLLMFVGATGKSAQIPLFTWLPDAMAGPTPVSALIHAATMVTAGIYLIARSNALFTLAPHTLSVITWIGLATAFLAATIATRQNDIKKVLAYSTVSQLGFMFLAIGTGNYVAAVFHVMTHAFFKALMFLGSGSVIHAMGGEQDIRNMGGLQKHMKITGITFLIGCLAISGIPGFSGFFSKDEILASAFNYHPVVYALALGTALMTAFYMFRLYFVTFTGKFRGTHDQEHHLHESPISMTLPLMILAVLSVIGGFVGIPEALGGHHELAHYLGAVIPASHGHLSHETEYLLMGLSTALVLMSIGFAWVRFKNFQSAPTPKGLPSFLEHKWYIDEFYELIVVRPIQWIAGFMHRIVEVKVIDGLVNGVGKSVQYGARQLRWLQSGQVGAYVLLMVIGMIALFFIQLFLK
jgi:NADH-quinone oxidoreductase subunit L